MFLFEVIECFEWATRKYAAEIPKYGMYIWMREFQLMTRPAL